MKQTTATDFNDYLKSSTILDFESDHIQSLIKKRTWQLCSSEEKVKQIYNFVRDEIKFGYNTNDAISASQVLKDGYGQCNTKSNLFMALLRAVGVPNRIHGFTINKALQKGAISGIWYHLSPDNILHSWVEVYVNETWYNLEGLILDKPYLKALQAKFSNCKTTFCGYGVFTDNFKNPQIEWNNNNTYIQKEGINSDFGRFATPDEFYQKHQQKLSSFKRWVYQYYVRHRMNKNVEAIRNGTM